MTFSGDEDCGDEITSPDTIEVWPCLNCARDSAKGDPFCSDRCETEYTRFAEAVDRWANGGQ